MKYIIESQRDRTVEEITFDQQNETIDIRNINGSGNNSRLNLLQAFRK